MKRVKIIVARTGYIYRGPVQHEDTDFITIHDEYTNREHTFNKTHLESIETLNEGGQQ